MPKWPECYLSVPEHTRIRISHKGVNEANLLFHISSGPPLYVALNVIHIRSMSVWPLWDWSKLNWMCGFFLYRTSVCCLMTSHSSHLTVKIIIYESIDRETVQQRDVSFLKWHMCSYEQIVKSQIKLLLLNTHILNQSVNNWQFGT